MKIKITLKLILILLIILLLVLLIPFILEAIKPEKTIIYNKVPYVFREDVREAYKIPVYPNEEFVYNLLWDYKIKNITILFKPISSPTNALYAVEAFELTNKLSQIYATNPIMAAQLYDQMRYIYLKRNFTAQEIESYDNIKREDEILKIIIVPPQFSNNTYVLGGGNKIFIYGKDKKGLDLATIRTILIAMKFSPETFLNKTK